MNGRNPAYRRCNEQTLVKTVDGQERFITFWKNVHQQFLISEGVINGATYTVEEEKLVTKEEGNAVYIQRRSDGWVKLDRILF